MGCFGRKAVKEKTYDTSQVLEGLSVGERCADWRGRCWKSCGACCKSGWEKTKDVAPQAIVVVTGGAAPVTDKVKMDPFTFASRVDAFLRGVGLLSMVGLVVIGAIALGAPTQITVHDFAWSAIVFSVVGGCALAVSTKRIFVLVAMVIPALGFAYLYGRVDALPIGWTVTVISATSLLALGIYFISRVRRKGIHSQDLH